MNKALSVYSNARVVPESSAIQGARATPTTPISPEMTASRRSAKRRKESRVVVAGTVMADMETSLRWLWWCGEAGAGRMPQPLSGGGHAPVRRESRQTAHSEVLQVGEAESGRDGRDHHGDAHAGEREHAGHQDRHRDDGEDH